MAVDIQAAFLPTTTTGNGSLEGALALNPPGGAPPGDPFSLLFAVPIPGLPLPAAAVVPGGEADQEPGADPLLEQLIASFMTPQQPLDPALAQWALPEATRPPSDLLWPPTLAGLPNVPITGDAAAVVTDLGELIPQVAPAGDSDWSQWRDLVNTLPQQPSATVSLQNNVQSVGVLTTQVSIPAPTMPAGPTTPDMQPALMAQAALTSLNTPHAILPGPAPSQEPLSQAQVPVTNNSLTSPQTPEPMTSAQAATPIVPQALVNAAVSSAELPPAHVAQAISPNAARQPNAPGAGRRLANALPETTPALDRLTSVTPELIPLSALTSPADQGSMLPPPLAPTDLPRPTDPQAAIDLPPATDIMKGEIAPALTAGQPGESNLSTPVPERAIGPTTPVGNAAASQPAPVQQPANPLERMVIQQVAKTVVRMTPDGDRQMVLRLTPSELGTVRITLNEHNGVITAHLHAEDAAVSQTIERLLPTLRNELKGADAVISDVQVDRNPRSVGESQASRDRQPDGDGRQQSSQGDHNQSQRESRQDRRNPEAPRFSLDPDNQPQSAPPSTTPSSAPRPRSNSAVDSLA